MYPHDAVVHFSRVAAVLSAHSDGFGATLGNPRLIHHADRLGMSMISGHNLLATVAEFLFIPLD
jgi:hypothetical protein